MEKEIKINRYICIWDDKEKRYTVINWKKDEPFEMYEDAVKKHHYRIIYAEGIKAAKCAALTADIEDILEDLNAKDK